MKLATGIQGWYTAAMPTRAKRRTGARAPYSRGTKRGKFDLEAYTVRELVERTGLSHETITRAARLGELPGRNFEGTAGWRFPHSAVMWWLAGSPGAYDLSLLLGAAQLAEKAS